MTVPDKKVFITVDDVFDRTEAAYRKVIEHYRRTGKRCMDPRAACRPAAEITFRADTSAASTL